MGAHTHTINAHTPLSLIHTHTNTHTHTINAHTPPLSHTHTYKHTHTHTPHTGCGREQGLTHHIRTHARTFTHTHTITHANLANSSSVFGFPAHCNTCALLSFEFVQTDCRSAPLTHRFQLFPHPVFWACFSHRSLPAPEIVPTRPWIRRRRREPRRM